jgi:plasmid stabilization system protein ParE
VKAVDLHRGATAEMIEAARFYELRRHGIGFRFLQRVEDACQRIAESPDAGSPLGRVDRKRSVPGFPYDVVYRIETQRVLVLAIMHQRRKPGYWKWRRYR